MSTLRCEELDFQLTADLTGQNDPTGNAIIKRIGQENTSTSPIPASSAVVLPALVGSTARARNVVVRAFGGAALVSTFSPATAANSTLIAQDQFAIIRVGVGEALYGLAATIG